MFKMSNKIVASGYLFLILLLSATSGVAQREMTIAAVQGPSNVSPVNGQSVVVTGIVTARYRTGFFVQTPDDKVDSDPKTSEGIFVFTREEPTTQAEVGALVTVSGRVEEFRPRADQNTLPITEINIQNGSVRVVSRNNPLPKPYTLTTADFMPNAIEQLEHLEGMRVAVEELTVVAPTDGRVINTAFAETNGTFYAVVKGIPRPFRGPGLDLAEFLFFSKEEREKLKVAVPKMSLFDSNPERLRIESSSLLGAKPLDVAAGSSITRLTGVMHYSYRTNTIFVDPDAKLSFNGPQKVVPMPTPSERQFVVAGMNLENFFDDRDDPDIKEDVVDPAAFERRLKKISLAIREHMLMPDVIGVVEAENLAGLKRLADRINKDAVAAGKLDPKYVAFLVDGNDGRGIDNGFLVKTSRVRVLETQQFGHKEKYRNPDRGEEQFLNDRPPLMARLALDDPRAGKSFEFTVVVNHLKSFLGYNDPRQMANVRMKKKLQAEFLARWADARQKANPLERIILVGDFNAFQFPDGVMDVVGTIRGTPAAADTVIMPSDDLVVRDLINLVDVIAAGQRYSYVFDGNAQVLDHILISETLRSHIKGFGYVRINADHPEAWRNDDTRAERFSDHDPAVAYFEIDP